MKKYLLYSLFAAAAFTMVSCDEDFNEGVADPQAWEQEEAISLPGFNLVPAASVDLAAAEGDMVTVFSVSSQNLPEGTTIDNIKLELSAYEAATRGAASVIVEATADGQVAVADLQAAVEEIYGKRPVERTLNAEVTANWIKDGQASVLKAPAIQIKATPEAPQISTEYYLIGTPNKWNILGTTLKFTHSGKDVYEDPNFSIVIPVVFPSDNDEETGVIPSVDANGECWFAITDSITINENLASGAWAQAFGCAEGNGNNGTEGSLKRRADLSDDGSWKVTVDEEVKFIKISLNMMEYTYKIELLNYSEFIYVPGNHQGWAPDKAPALRSPNSDGVYTGYTYLNGNFKFTKERNWNAEYNFNSFKTMSDIFFNNDGSNINIEEEGFYQIVADVANEDLKATKTTWGIIGDATADGWNSDQDMTWDAEKACWTATITLIDGTIKFRANDDWAINVGGSADNLSEGADNIPVTAGTYDVELHLDRSTSNNMFCTLTKK